VVAKCPHCQHPDPLSRPTPGRVRVRCPRCHRPVAAAVPTGAAAGHRHSALPTAVRTIPNAERPAAAADFHGTEEVETPRPADCQVTPPTRLPAPGSAPASGGDESPAGPPTQIPGYRIERVIGHGGMGTVYLGTQLALDRPVALKVMSKRWAADPVFVARFIREAYAAARLNHPNVVQVYDIGDVDGTKFFSMEYVPGRTLSDVVKAEGKLDPEIAVGYILQAARGLKHAHDRGMIHRDVKPDNLLLDGQGIVKVADLGLVRTPGMAHTEDHPAEDASPSRGLRSIPPNLTGVRMALGTPAYMAPEQCRDATAVDHRADIYSLGATLYVLVTGRLPFDDTTAVGMMTKQAYEPLIPPEVHVGRVPRELSAVIQKMMAKDPADRFADMGELIRTLEGWLGVHTAGSFSPRDDQIDQIEQIVRQFNTTPSAVRRRRLLGGAASSCVLLAVLLMFFGQVGWAFGIAGMVLQGAAAYFVLNGVTRKTHLYLRVRQFVAGLSAGDLVVAAAGVGLFGVLLWMLGLFWVWVGFGLVGMGLALALWLGLDRQVDRERRVPLEGCEQLLRRMRLHGVDEAELRLFVAKYAGRDWEEFFEAVFGYEAKLAARLVLLRGGCGGVREKFAAWREPLIALIDRFEKARQEARERKLLEQVEKARLLAAGLVEQTAGEQAATAAAAMIRQAGDGRYIDPSRRTVGPGACTPVGGPSFIRLMTGHEPAHPTRPDDAPPDRFDALVELIAGPTTRAALAALLLTACAAWVYQNRLYGAELAARAAYAVEGATAADPGPAAARPLVLSAVPAEWTRWCDSANVGWAGALLLASLYFRGNRMGLLVLLGAAVVVLGHQFGILAVEPIRDYHASWLLGTVFALVGYRLGRP
jgi:serine/threonine protein kinase